jgi:hypothetical protein
VCVGLIFSRRSSVSAPRALAWNGAYLDQDGVLHEQFGFIPLGWLLGLVGVVLLGLAWVRRK